MTLLIWCDDFKSIIDLSQNIYLIADFVIFPSLFWKKLKTSMISVFMSGNKIMVKMAKNQILCKLPSFCSLLIIQYIPNKPWPTSTSSGHLHAPLQPPINPLIATNIIGRTCYLLVFVGTCVKWPSGNLLPPTSYQCYSQSVPCWPPGPLLLSQGTLYLPPGDLRPPWPPVIDPGHSLSASWWHPGPLAPCYWPRALYICLLVTSSPLGPL